MTIHTFIFRWKPDITEAQIAQVATSVRGLQGQIPGLVSVHIGPNISPRSRGFEYGGVMHFTDRAALEAYNDHPAHQAILPSIFPLLEDVIEVDFEA